jgi:tRNA threonylcarbamoyladenosine biosynthesis protein TsaE
MSEAAQLRDDRVAVHSPLHRAILGSRVLDWPDEAACEADARAFAARPALRDALIVLHGTLGAGKTTFVRHLLRALGVTGRIKSPTYALMEPYTPAGGPAWHFDLYRLGDPQEWEDAGFREIVAGPGLKLVEWPEHAAGLLPPADLELHLEPTEGEHRRVHVEARTPRGLELLG